MTFDKHGSAGYLANHMARLFAEALRKRIGPLGLSPGTFPALLELWSEDGLTQAELVLRLDIEQATLARTLARMERDGLIVREPDPDDARVRRIRLTSRARALAVPATKAATEVNDAVLATFSEQERQAFLALMSKAIAALRSPHRRDGG